jgi:type IV secretory pathway VirB10-like protein
MKPLAVVGTACLIFLLGNAAASMAQEPDKPEKHDDKAKPEKQDQPPKKDEKPPKQEPAKPENKPAKPEPADKAAKPESKPAKPEQPKQVQQQNQKTVQQSQRDNTTHGNGAHGRIADDRYRASFGTDHHFHVQRSDYEHRRFAYGGYNFVFIDAWPGDWGYNDDVYVVYEDGVYYMYDVVHPGVHITLNIAD